MLAFIVEITDSSLWFLWLALLRVRDEGGLLVRCLFLSIFEVHLLLPCFSSWAACRCAKLVRCLPLAFLGFVGFPCDLI